MSTNRNDVATPAGSARRAYEAPLWQSPAGSLIGRIGNSEPFLVGANSRLAWAPMGGRLYLSVNDDYMQDNTGAYRVTVTVDPR